jgi:hypothetical protein
MERELLEKKLAEAERDVLQTTTTTPISTSCLNDSALTLANYIAAISEPI